MPLAHAPYRWQLTSPTVRTRGVSASRCEASNSDLGRFDSHRGPTSSGLPAVGVHPISTVELSVERTTVNEGSVGRLEALSLRLERAQEARGDADDWPPKEVAQVRILPGALTNPQVKAQLRESVGLYLDRLSQIVRRPRRHEANLYGPSRRRSRRPPRSLVPAVHVHAQRAARQRLDLTLTAASTTAPAAAHHGGSALRRSHHERDRRSMYQGITLVSAPGSVLLHPAGIELRPSD